jgi:hypothetical protein
MRHSRYQFEMERKKNIDQNRNGTPAFKKNQGDATYWRIWYVIVFVFLLLQIVLYYFITQYFKN